MIRALLGLLVLSAALATTGCALTEAVTPPPPGIGALPKQAHQLFEKPVTQCVSPEKAGMSINAQTQALQMDRAQLQVLIDGEVTRWERRRYYLERELRFYEREVRRTGGSLMYTNLAKADGFLKVTTDSGFTDQIKRQKEREYNERQHLRFSKHLAEARARHQERMGLYQQRLDQLDTAIKACSELRLAVRKAKEDKELHKHTKPVPNFIPDLKTRKVAAMPLPPQEPLPADQQSDPAGADPAMAETMEELMQALPEGSIAEAETKAKQPGADSTQAAADTVQAEAHATPAANALPPALSPTAPAPANPVSADAIPASNDGKTEKMAETMEELLNTPSFPIHTQAASR